MYFENIKINDNVTLLDITVEGTFIFKYQIEERIRVNSFHPDDKEGDIVELPLLQAIN